MTSSSTFETQSHPARHEAISDALSAWLTALDLDPSPMPLPEAAARFMSFRKLFCQLAPDNPFIANHSLSFNVSNSDDISKSRGNAHCLVYWLVSWFQLSEHTRYSPSKVAPTINYPELPINLTPRAERTLLSLHDNLALEEGDHSVDTTIIGEVLLCAAVYSERKKMYINAIMQLDMVHQDALAASISRTSIEKLGLSGLQSVSEEKDFATNVTKEPQMLENKAMETNTDFDTAMIPPVQYRALATEVDDLRTKVVTSKSKRIIYKGEANELRDHLDKANQEIRNLTSIFEKQETDLESMAKVLRDRKEKIRYACIAAEELDVLRAKASSVEKLEESIKRGTKRLQEVSCVIQKKKDLEQQLDAYREHEIMLEKYNECLESQLNSSNDRVHRLVEISSDVSCTLKNREAQIYLMENEIKGLKDRLETADNQLLSMNLESCSVSSTGYLTATHSTSSTANVLDSPEGSVVGNSDTQDSGSLKGSDKSNGTAFLCETSKINMKLNDEEVCKEICDELGFQISWNEVLECVRAAINSSQRDDKPNHQNYSSNSTIKSQHQNQSEDGSALSQKNAFFSIRKESDTLLAPVRGGNDTYGFSSNLAAFCPNEDDQAERRGNNFESRIHDGQSNALWLGLSQDGQETVEACPYLVSIPQDDLPELKSQEGSLANKRSFSVRVSANRTFEIHSGMQGNQKLALERNHASGSVKTESAINSMSDSKATSVRGSGTPVVIESEDSAESISYNSETRALIQQAQAELKYLQDTVNIMRAEREACGSMDIIMKQLTNIREEICIAKALAMEKDAESTAVRNNFSVMIKKFDSLECAKKTAEKRVSSVLKDKDHLILILKEALNRTGKELLTAKHEKTEAQKVVKSLEDVQLLAKEKLHNTEVMCKEQEGRVACLNVQYESTDMMNVWLRATVSKSDSMLKQLQRERESNKQNMATQAQREGQLAEEAKKKARQVAGKNRIESIGGKETAAAAASSKLRDGYREGSSRKGFSDFLRRLSRGKIPAIRSKQSPRVNNSTTSE